MEKSRKNGGFFRTIIVLALIVMAIKYYYPDCFNLISDKVSQVLVVVNKTDASFLASASNDELNLVSMETPEDADEYAKQIGMNMVSNVATNQDLFGVDIDNTENLYLGEPYTIMSLDEEEKISDIYYYPVCEDSTIKLILSVYKNNGQWNATISEDISDELNGLETAEGEKYLLYYSNGTIFAETTTDKSALYVDEDTYDATETDNSTTYESKIKQYNDLANGNIKDVGVNRRKAEYSELTDVCTGEGDRCTILDEDVPTSSKVEKSSGLISTISSFFSSDSVDSSSEYAVNNSDSVILGMSDCLVSQVDTTGTPRGMCWASSVATIVRYMTGDTSLSAIDVCERMNVGLDDGGDIDMKKKALTEYGFDYTKINSQVSWSQLKKNIEEKKPIAISSFSENEGHAVTIIGYSEANSMKTVMFWNSGNQKVQIATYNESGMAYSYNSYTWNWTASLY